MTKCRHVRKPTTSTNACRQPVIHMNAAFSEAACANESHRRWSQARKPG